MSETNTADMAPSPCPLCGLAQVSWTLYYRLAPENRFPAALEDSLEVYRRLLRDGIDASAIAIGGDSAGGNLAMATLLALRDAAEELPAACFLMSPWLDMTNEGKAA